MGPVDPTSFLFITLDSLRYDTFVAASTPNIDSVGSAHRAAAPGYFTYSSHAAMFVGFTPGDASTLQQHVNPRVGKVVRLHQRGVESVAPPFATVRGRTIIDGFRRAGFRTIGSGAVRWFDRSTPAGRLLTDDFQRFHYPGATWALDEQLAFLEHEISVQDGPVFTFLNVGETHFPYWHAGADWSRDVNPCHPVRTEQNDADEARRRQVACAEWVDHRLRPLLDAFAGANTIICADHGDAWGEDGLWGHGFHHPAVVDVPLVLRLQHAPTASAVERTVREAVAARGAAGRRLRRMRSRLAPRR